MASYCGDSDGSGFEERRKRERKRRQVELEMRFGKCVERVAFELLREYSDVTLQCFLGAL